MGLRMTLKMFSFIDSLVDYNSEIKKKLMQTMCAIRMPVHALAAAGPAGVYPQVSVCCPGTKMAQAEM